MNETDKLIDEQFKTLPASLRQAINIVPWKAFVQEIGRANTLDTEQVAALEQETLFILYGFENPNDYIASISREMNLSEENALTIAESVADKIFTPISEKSEAYLNSATPTSTPEIPSSNLPMVEPASAQGSGEARKGEVAHTVDSKQYTVDSKPESIKPEETKVSIPDYRYEANKDPYREPLA